jgi:hypothetical protein
MALWRGLRHIQLFHNIDLVTFLSGSRIVHIYGRIREELTNSKKIDWKIQDQDPQRVGESGLGDYHAKMKSLLDAAYSASRGLRVIDPHDKGADDAEIEIARAAIAKARRVFILGYGFDEHNSGRLNLQETLRDHTKLANKRIAFANYQDINQINKRGSKIFYGAPNCFQPGGPAIQDRYEKSIRNTYDALALDFDLAD